MFNVVSDPYERVNLARSHASLLSRMQQQLDEANRKHAQELKALRGELEDLRKAQASDAEGAGAADVGVDVDGERVLTKMPQAVYVYFDDAPWTVSEDLGKGVYPLTPVSSTNTATSNEIKTGTSTSCDR